MNFPVERGAWRHYVALFRGLDCRLQQRIESQLAVIAQDRRPGIDRAGNGDGVGRGQRDRMHFALQVPGGFGRLGCPARAVVGDDLALATCLQKREAIAADPGGLRLDHSEQCTARHRGVRSRAAGTHDFDRRHRRHRV